MSGMEIAILGFAAMLGLIALRMPVGLAMLVVGALGYIHLTSLQAFLSYIKTTPYHNFANYTLSVIPLFILMGALAEVSGLSTDLFRAARAWIGHRRGGLASSTIGACTAFGAICGSSVATTATFGRTALPEFRRHGYDLGFATGAIAVGGTLGILIPPSVILVVYAISTEQNIVKLFQAALIPGLLATAFYLCAIAYMVRRNPNLAPPSEKLPMAERWRALAGAWPAALVTIVMLGGIYGGIFTPTEGAAAGATAMLLVGLARRSIGFKEFGTALIRTAETTAMIFVILLGAEVFNAFLAFSQLPMEAAQAIAGLGLPPHAVLVLLLAFYILLGAVMDELAMILLTLPVFFPIITAPSRI
jgi:C4-dicarboxylate transporter DctM subunit